MSILKLSDSLQMKVKYLLHPTSKRKEFAYRRAIPSDLRLFYENKSNHWHLLGTDIKKAISEAERLSRLYDSQYSRYRQPDSVQLKAEKEAAIYGLKLQCQKPITMTMTEHNGEVIEFLDNHPDYQRWIDDMDFTYSYHVETSNGYEKRYHPLEPHHQLMEDTFKGKRTHSLKKVEEFTLSKITSARKQQAAKTRFESFIPFTDSSDIRRIKKEHFKQYIKHLETKGLKGTTIKTYVHELITFLNAYWSYYSKDSDPPTWSKGLKFPDNEENEEPRVITPQHLKEIECIIESKMTKNFLIHHLAAIQMNTGCRISEIAGLRVEDVYLEAPIPYIRITKHEARSIKTKGSKRLIPLVGVSLKIMRHILSKDRFSEYVFPTLIRSTEHGNEVSNSPSSMVNKWLKSKFDKRYTSHYFRHTLTARAKMYGYTDADIGKLLGWSSKGGAMFDHYGDISNLPKMKEIIENTISIKDYPVF